ncbi:MAG: hypothetical protein WKF84_02200 [Pyrinomonadaceae bacterium]
MNRGDRINDVASEFRDATDRLEDRVDDGAHPTAAQMRRGELQATGLAHRSSDLARIRR